MNIRGNELLHVGHSVPGVDSRAKLTGRAVYTTDLQIEGILHAKILRSTVPHARIRAIDVSGALAMPGIIAVVTGADLAQLDPCYGMYIRDQTVLAIDKVRYVGEPVAAVAALDEAQACRALERIRVEYEPLPPLMTVEQSLATDAPTLFANGRVHDHALPPPPPHGEYTQEPSPNILFEYRHGFGDVDEWLARSAHVFEHSFGFARLSHYGLEPHACIARFDGAEVDVWANNQDPFLLRQDIARIFKLQTEQVRFHAGFVGGGFGAKSYCKTEPIAVLLARKAQRPVRLVLAMAESMMTVCEHAAQIHLRCGVSESGETLVREAFVDLDGGAYADASPSVAMRLGTRMGSPYRWRALRTQVRVVRTTTVPAGSFRGFGSGHIAWASESQIDDIARRIQHDPCEFRMRNMAPLWTSFAPGENPFDSDLLAGLRAVAECIGYEKPRLARRGIGIAVAMKGAGAAHCADASVQISARGYVEIAAGVTEIGQSTRTALTQIAAEVLHVPIDRVTVLDINTAKTPFDAGTHASCGLTVAGLAMREAAENARRAVLAFAAEKLGCRPDELTFDNFDIWHGGERHALVDLAAESTGAEPLFRGEGSKQTPSGSFFWMPSWTAAEVEVDTETGLFKVLRLVTAVDVGKAINPQRCLSQAEGAAVQGLGQAMFEQLSYAGESWPNAEPLRYRVPRIADVPAQFDTLVLEQEHGPGPFGAKGVGEAGNLTAPAAIANAIADAVGARVTDLPLTPDKVLKAIWSRGATQPVDRATRRSGDILAV
jgi:CO/xanthine dehydrogenase Mo-binding subunit